jgi:hypothetical protein
LNSLGLGAWFVVISSKLLHAMDVMPRKEVVVVQKELFATPRFLRQFDHQGALG